MRKTFTIAEFMAGKHNETFMDRLRERITNERIERWVKTATGLTVPVTTGLLIGGTAFANPAAIPAGASIGAGTTALILKAFDPLIQLITSLAYPIAGVMIAGGCLFIMIGSRDKGMDMLRNAAIGYILVQLSPLLLKILVGIGTGI